MYSFTDKIRYGDLDTNRHLNNVAVHQFFESARVAYFYELFPDVAPLDRPPTGRGFIFAETHVRFASPGFYEDVLRVDVWPAELKRSSVKVMMKMICEGDGRLVSEGWGTLVGYDYGSGRAAPLPDAVTVRLQEEIDGD